MITLALVIALAVVVVYVVGIALFERLAPPGWVRRYRLLANPLLAPLAGLSLGFAVIETTGRASGQARRTPVGGRLRGDSFWLVAADGRRSQYVRNIAANPDVRVKVHGRWRKGTAHLLPEDDPRRRLLHLNPPNSLFLWIAGNDLLTVRIDLR